MSQATQKWRNCEGTVPDESRNVLSPVARIAKPISATMRDEENYLFWVSVYKANLKRTPKGKRI